MLPAGGMNLPFDAKINRIYNDPQRGLVKIV